MVLSPVSVREIFQSLKEFSWVFIHVLFYVCFESPVSGDIGYMEVIIGKILFDHIAFISREDDELIKTVVGINFHNIPSNGHPPNHYYGFWFDPCFLAQACPVLRQGLPL